jgi:hypothetical protein
VKGAALRQFHHQVGEYGVGGEGSLTGFNILKCGVFVSEKAGRGPGSPELSFTSRTSCEKLSKYNHGKVLPLPSPAAIWTGKSRHPDEKTREAAKRYGVSKSFLCAFARANVFFQVETSL